MTNRWHIINDQVKKFRVQPVFLFSMKKLSLASSEMRKWESGLKIDFQKKKEGLYFVP